MWIVDLLAVVASGAVAVVYAHFALRVMPRLGRESAPQAIARMRELNTQVERAPFLSVFFAAAALGGYQIVRYLRGDSDAAGLLAGAAGAAYLAGFLLTIAYNVPRNQRLARIGSDGDASAYWATFHRQWSSANVVRTVLTTASVGFGVAALVAGVMDE